MRTTSVRLRVTLRATLVAALALCAGAALSTQAVAADSSGRYGGYQRRVPAQHRSATHQVAIEPEAVMPTGWQPDEMADGQVIEGEPIEPEVPYDSASVPADMIDPETQWYDPHEPLPWDESADCCGGCLGDICPQLIGRFCCRGHDCPPGPGPCDYCQRYAPPWYFEADFNLMQRQRAQTIPITIEDRTIIVQNVPVVVQVVTQTARSVNFDYVPGTRLVLGRNMFRDIYERRHSLEFTYYGLNEWSSSDTLFGTRTIVGFFFEVGTLNSPFPDDIGGFNDADQHTLEYGSNLNNYELNYIIRRDANRDRLVARPTGEWVRESAPSWRPKMFAGLRHVSITENFNFFSFGLTENLFNGQDTVRTGNYHVLTHNDLFGAQLGAGCDWDYAGISLGFDVRAGYYFNVAAQTSDVVIKDPLIPTPNRYIEASTIADSFVGDARVKASYDLTRNIALHFSYDMLWVGSIALAPEQLDFTLEDPPTTSTGGSTFFSGFNLGAEIRY